MPPPDKIITSAANPEIKRIRSLGMKKYRDETGLFTVEGARHVMEALAAGWEIDTLLYAAEAQDIPHAKGQRLCITDDILKRVTGRDNAQDVLGVFKQRWHEFSELHDDRNALWIGLEEIRDPGNLGTIVRTAQAANAAGVILIGNTCDPFSPEAVRASMGSFAHVRLIRATAEEFISARKKFKGRIVGTHLKGAKDYRTVGYAAPLILLMGGEQNGLSDRLASACDDLAKIPMPGGTESLNLAVSAGIMLYEAARKFF